jgi:hypothetical protein
MAAHILITVMVRRHTSIHLTLALAALLAACEDAPAPAAGSAAPAEPPKDAVEVASPEKPVTEADLGGVPVYPGGQLLQPQSEKRASGEDDSLAIGTFEVPDAPTTVASFYRKQLGALGGGEPVMEAASPTGGVILMVDDKASNRAVQVEISSLGTGSRVKVTAVEFPTG